MLIQDFLHRSAERLPDQVALVCDQRRLTYAAVDESANRLAHALRDHGVKRGDRVALCLGNSAEAIVGIFASLKAGAVFVVINRSTKPEKLAYILNNCRATALIGERAKRGTIEGALDRVPSLRFAVLAGRGATGCPAADRRQLDFDVIQASYPASRPAPVNIDLDLACLIYTSGSTGDPKGVMVDHAGAVFAASSVSTYLENVEHDVVLNVLPLSFGYGLYQALMMFRVGGRLVLERSCAYPMEILHGVQSERVTGFPGVPTIFATLLQTDLSQFDLSSLRYITNAGAALPPSHVMELRRKLPATKLYSMYGQTETKRTLYLPPEQVEVRPTSVGVPIPGTEAWIENEAGQRLGPGEVGELVVRGRHVARGYWDDPEATAARFRSGAIPGERICYSGDLFSSDEEGYFYFVARKDDIIKTRGEKVAPIEVERVLHRLHGVVEAVVIGVPDAMLGQAIKAFIVPNGVPLDRRAVLAHCRVHLEDHLVPTIVEFCAELPKTHSGKIRRIALT